MTHLVKYLSCLPTHSTTSPPPSFTCTVPPSLRSPATILSCSRSHRSLASAQSLEQGAQLGRQGLRHVWQCFSRPLYREWLKRSQGCICCSVQEEISVKVYLTTERWVTQITPETRSTNKMGKVDKEQTGRQAQGNYVWHLSRGISASKWQNNRTNIINPRGVPVQKTGIGWRLKYLIIQATTPAPNCLCERNTDSRKGLNIHERHISLIPEINSLASHSPATEVRRIVRQNPNLASDFIVIRAIDFGLVVGSPPSLAILLLVLSSADSTLFSPSFPHVSSIIWTDLSDMEHIDKWCGKGRCCVGVGWRVLITNVHCR